MRNTVTFGYAAPLLVVSDEDGILSVAGAGWFVDLLRKVPTLELETDLLQEDWGVAVLARYAGKNFWIGLSAMDENQWIAHVHHRTFAWLQRLGSGGEVARRALVGELERALREANATAMSWFDERDRNLREPAGSPSAARGGE